MSNTPRITAEERRENESLRASEAWVAVVVGEDGVRQYLANPAYTHRNFTDRRGSATRYSSRDVALREARLWKESERRGQPVHAPREERLMFAWIVDVDAERVK